MKFAIEIFGSGKKNESETCRQEPLGALRRAGLRTPVIQCRVELLLDTGSALELFFAALTSHHSIDGSSVQFPLRNFSMTKLARGK